MSTISQISIIAGANHEFGKTVAESLIKLSSQKKVGTLHNFIIFVSGEAVKIDEASKELNEIKGAGTSIIKFVSGVDLTDMDELPERLKEIENIIKSFVLDSNFKNSSDKRLVLFTTAGPSGGVSKKAAELSPYEIQEYQLINLSSFSFLVYDFTQWRKLAHFGKTIIVNTSSLAAIQPYPYNSFYCTIKVARDMHMESFTFKMPIIKTLNYAPGPMDNNVQKQIRQEAGDPLN